MLSMQYTVSSVPYMEESILVLPITVNNRIESAYFNIFSTSNIHSTCHHAV
jgi:hypothetical protein